MTENLLIILRSGGIAAALLVISVLLTLPGADKRANRCLALLLAILVLNLAHGFYTQSTILETMPYLFMLGFPTYLGLGPLLYFYTRALTDAEWTFGWNHCLHFLPLALTWLLLLPIFLQPPEVKREMIELSRSAGAGQWGVVFIAYVPIVLSLVGYSVACLRQLRRHQTRILDEFSSIEQVNLNWLRGLAVFMILISLSVLLPVPEGSPRLFWFKIISVTLIFYIGHMGIRQPLIFRPGRGGPNSNSEVAAGTPSASTLESRPTDGELNVTASRKYQNTGLSDADAQHYWAQLQTLIEADRPYLDPDLTLAELAQKLEVHPAQLSQIINACAQKNFYDFINERRIQIAQDLLLEQDGRWTILDIALEAGFNSKSTFYSQFKKHSGMTPTAFRRRAQKSPA